MKTAGKSTFIVLMAIMTALFFAGCSSSEEDSDVSSGSSASMPSAEVGSGALTVASSVSVVEAVDESGESSVSAGGESLRVSTRSIPKDFRAAISVDGFAADSDYNADPTDVFVHEESVQVFDTVNSILCSIDQTKYAEMKGKGNYRAQVDADQCESGKDDAAAKAEESQNQSSASGMIEYENWTVNSSREPDEPHVVKLWVEQAGGEHDPPALIYAKMEIYRSASDDNPYGYFRLNFIGHPVDESGAPDTSTVIFKGYMQTVQENGTNAVLLQFFNEMSFDNKSFTERATFKRSADGLTGSGTLSAPDFSTMRSENDTPGTLTFNIAYNEGYFLKSKGDAQKCFDRDNFQETVWSYGMYDANGARVQINSGFPIRYTTGGEDFFGWVGYHGLWMEGAKPGNGDTVYKQTYTESGEVAEPYTVFSAGGRLIQHTKKNTTLGDLKNVPLQWGEFDVGQGEYVQYRVEWNATEEKMKKTAQLNQQDWSWTPLTPTDLAFDANDYSFHFWSEGLGGSGSFKLKDSGNNPVAPTNGTVVIFHTQDIVYPTDTVPSTLLCFERCPDPGNLDAGDPNFANIDWFNTGLPTAGDFHQYNFSTGDMLLKYSTDPIVLDSANEQNPWGLHSGLLFEDTGPNMGAITCGGNSCLWQAYDNMASFYTWETGPESWNQFTAIKDASNDFARFDPPVKTTYQHTQADTGAVDYKYNGAKFNLEYAGFGNLHGIPGTCITADGEAANCGPGTRWIPEFSIPAGTEVTDVNDSTPYVLKPLGMEQRMTMTDAANCAGLSLPSYGLPSSGGWQNPNIGDKPEVTNAPAVIGGVLQ